MICIRPFRDKAEVSALSCDICRYAASRYRTSVVSISRRLIWLFDLQFVNDHRDQRQYTTQTTIKCLRPIQLHVPGIPARVPIGRTSLKPACFSRIFASVISDTGHFP